MKLDRLRIRSLECSRRNHRRRLTELESAFQVAGDEFKTASALIGAIRPLVEAITRDFEAHGKRLTALEASEVELREHCQGNVPMSVFNALAERVKAIEVGERATGKFDEDEAYDEWHATPWPPSMLCKHERARLEQAFREGFRAGRK